MAIEKIRRLLECSILDSFLRTIRNAVIMKATTQNMAARNPDPGLPAPQEAAVIETPRAGGILSLDLGDALFVILANHWHSPVQVDSDFHENDRASA